MTPYIFVYTTFPKQEDAVYVARRVIEKKLASCVNIFPQGRSFYNWDGVVQDAEECVMIVKTVKYQWDALQAEIENGHPYEIPCITAIPMLDANKPFLAWMEDQVS